MRLRMLGHAVCAFVAAATATATATAAAADASAQSAQRIPFVVGLTTVRATTDPRGDYESLKVVDAITGTGYRITSSGEVPADDGSGLLEINVVRRVRAEDQRAAHRMRNYFHSGDAEQFTGTVPGFSAVMVTDLRSTGRTQLTYLEVGAMFGMSMVKRELSGTIARVDDMPVTLPMLVNGRRVRLPVIHAKGRLSDASGGEQFEFHVLDDPANPILLRARGPGFKSAVIKIEYPEAAGSPQAIEQQLSTDRKAEVYGIYFAFARADLRPQSEPVLREIAAVLKKHPDWTLRIDGHTDGIGAQASNLDLSRRRAAAVKAALVKRYDIAAGRLLTGGFGESRPRADNAITEGRALNRRVELTRP